MHRPFGADLTRRQAKQFMRIALDGRCRNGMPKSVRERFLEERNLDITAEHLPDASAGIKSRVGVLSKLGLRNPVTAYFIDSHNRNVSRLLMENKKLKEGPSDCKLRVGKAFKAKGNKVRLVFPDGTSAEYAGKYEGRFMMAHLGELVGRASPRDYQKYRGSR
jgi:hypothetical protein